MEESIKAFLRIALFLVLAGLITLGIYLLFKKFGV